MDSGGGVSRWARVNIAALRWAGAPLYRYAEGLSRVGRSGRVAPHTQHPARGTTAMPTYDYRCEANGQVYEVQHSMVHSPKTWGELRRMACALSGDAAILGCAPVTGLMGAAGVVSSRVLEGAEAPACAGGGCSGACRM